MVAHKDIKARDMNTDLHHPLITELPEHRESIHELKMNNAHFRRLFDEYHRVDREIVRIEEEIEPASDTVTEGLKKRRLQLKDELHHMLVAHAGR